MVNMSIEERLGDRIEHQELLKAHRNFSRAMNLIEPQRNPDIFMLYMIYGQ